MELAQKLSKVRCYMYCQFPACSNQWAIRHLMFQGARWSPTRIFRVTDKTYPGADRRNLTLWVYAGRSAIPCLTCLQLRASAVA